MNYYNEFDPKAAAWLRELIARGHIPPGEVDERSITDVSPTDLSGFTQCHFFAGIGGWSLALQLAGWPADRPVWTGSCPCQPFSAAGKRLGRKDPRHLWPAFRRLINQCAPPVVFGEQVASSDGRKWLARVFANLEAMGYAAAGADLCAAGVSAPHIRQRLWWVGERVADSDRQRPPAERGLLRPEASGREPGQVSEAAGRGATRRLADTNGRDAGAERQQRGGQQRQQPEDGGAGGMADPRHESEGRSARSSEAEGGRAFGHPSGCSDLSGLAHARGEGLQELSRGRQQSARSSQASVPWDSYDLLPCTDGKARRIEPGSFPLAHGMPARVGRLRGYGNAIVPQVAAEFIAAYLEVTAER